MNDLNLEILATFQKLPPELREDVMDYIQFLVYRREARRQARKETQYTAHFGNSDGLLILDESLDEPIKLYENHINQKQA